MPLTDNRMELCNLNCRLSDLIQHIKGKCGLDSTGDMFPSVNGWSIFSMCLYMVWEMFLDQWET